MYFFKSGRITTWLILLGVIMLFSGCGMFKKKKEPPPPPPEPTRVVLEFEATADINPNAEGRPSPLGVRIYQLASYPIFGRADFFSLYDNDAQVLGRELLKKQEIVLRPGEKRTVYFATEPGAHTVGLLGTFKDYAAVQWKAAAGVRENKTTVINVIVSRTGIAVR